MNVCRVCQSFTPSLTGLSSHLVPLTKAQASKGLSFDLIAKKSSKKFNDLSENVKVHYFNPEKKGLYNFFPFSGLNYGFKAHNIMKGLDYDLIHGHQGVCFGLVFKNLNKPFIYSCHDAVILPEEYKIFNNNVSLKMKYSNYLITKLLTRKASKVTAVSDFVRDRLIKYYNLPKEKIVTIPSGVDLNMFKPLKVEENDNFIVLFAGRFIRRKGVHIILKAIPRIVERNKRIKFVFVGGREGDELYSLVKDSEKKYDNIKVIDWVEQNEMPRLYNKCDLFLHPSVFEAASKVFLEALACGKPVINCKRAGYSKLIRDNNCGALVDFGSVKQLTDVILKFAEKGYDFKKNCLNAVKDYSWDKIAEKYVPVYEELL